jgi:hypothetical protein
MLHGEPLDAFLPKLAQDKSVREAFEEVFGERASAILDKLSSGETLIGDEVSAVDLISDLVLNESEAVESLFGLGSAAGVFAINVMQFGPVFWVWAPDFDSTGYFPDARSALAYAESNWAGFIDDFNAQLKEGKIDERGDPVL